MNHALIIASFGSREPTARASITMLERTLSEAAPGYTCIRAFTSSIIRHILANRGENILSPTAALEQLRRGGVGRVVVQPTHLIYGKEYNKLKSEVLAMADCFEKLTIGHPLLADSRDILTFAARLSQNYPAFTDEAIVFMGHGTEHFAGMAYPALQTALRLMGRNDIYIGVMNGWPGLPDILRQLETDGPRRVRLLPLLLTAGKHVRRELAGEWRERLELAGYTVRCSFTGLCELPWVWEMYREKLLDILPTD